MYFLKQCLVINPDLQHFKDICKALVPATQKSFRDRQHRIRFCCCSSAWVVFCFNSSLLRLICNQIKLSGRKSSRAGPWVTWHLAKIEKYQKSSLKTGGHQQIIIIIVVTVSLGFTGLLLLWVNSYLPDYYYLGTWCKKPVVFHVS